VIEAPLWSVLICTLASRREKLTRLLAYLLPQCETDGRVEVIAYRDNGQVSVAAKRQALLDAAAGKYVSFVDDDDVVDPQFVALVTTAMGKDPDYVAFPNAYYVAGVRQPVRILVGLQHGGWRDDTAGGLLYRDITHVNPVRASIAKQADFLAGPGWVGEDWGYTQTVRKLARTQAEAGGGKPLYHYFHDPADSVQHGTQGRDALLRAEVDSPCFRWLEEPA
jgi:glycosyltransferase involved in cell wall biosynthesis